MPAHDPHATARLNDARLEALLKLNEMASASFQEITDFALEQAVVLTKSKIGYLAFVSEAQDVLTMHSWSKTAMAECAIADKPRVYPLETTGLWGEAVRQRRPIVTNDYGPASRWARGLPSGHVELRRHLNVPVFDGDRIVLVAGVGNKEEEYDESDVRQLTLLMQGMWMLIERHREQEELKRHRNELEQLVELRTSRLTAAMEELQRNREELQVVYDGILDGVLVAELATMRLVRVNASISQMLGYSQEELLAMSVPQIHPPETVPAVRRRFEAMRASQAQATENVPLLRRDGALVYADIHSHPTVYNGVACAVAIFHDTTEKKRADDLIQQERLHLRSLLELYDRESRLIGFEIHDGLAQYLAGAIMHLSTFERKSAGKAADDWAAFETGLQLVRQSHRESRRLASGLPSSVLDNLGVVAAVQELVQRVQERQPLPAIEFVHDGVAGRLPSPLENCVFRIVQEGLNNACRHSGSATVRVVLRQSEHRLSVEIQDWGVGFQPAERKDGHFGLLGVRERGRLFGGRVTIESSPGKGARIRVDLPLLQA